MTVAELIKKLQQRLGTETIVSVRIEFGDGSVYSDPGLERRVSTRPGVANPRDLYGNENLEED
jgi:hypothetical protein